MNILRAILNKNGLTGADFSVSNANHYLCELEKKKLISRKWSNKITNGSLTRFKVAFMTPKQRIKAKRVFNVLLHQKEKNRG